MTRKNTNIKTDEEKRKNELYQTKESLDIMSSEDKNNFKLPKMVFKADQM